MMSGSETKKTLDNILQRIEEAVASNDEGRVIRNLIRYQALLGQTVSSIQTAIR